MATPTLRSLPWGAFLPDPWLLLLLVAIPVKIGSLGRASFLVFLFGALRSAVTVVSPFSSWAALGGALAFRWWSHRHLSDDRFLPRFLVGGVSTIPMAFLDWRTSELLGLALPIEIFLWRSFWVAALWALLRTPPSLNAQRELAV
jgi:hypothetical protein